MQLCGERWLRGATLRLAAAALAAAYRGLTFLDKSPNIDMPSADDSRVERFH
ncbi:MAG: hypothetical protein JWP58_4590 [Hymenobacter sp.]|jgi:hypothetical protein|nr:hypothetical protein [Hymenobacter sp.]